MRSRARSAAGMIVDMLIRVSSRRSVVRIARFTLSRARLDAPNSMATNGEVEVQRWALRSAAPGSTAVVLDVGANVGAWSTSLLDQAEHEGRAVQVHAFEPSAYTAARLEATLEGRPAVVQRRALSDVVGEAELHVTEPGGGTNSLVGSRPSSSVEVVSTTTLDDYCREQGISAVALLKVDTEGNDLVVLRGAQELLAKGALAAIQFEYNQRWIEASLFLRDAFELLGGHGYQIGKVTPHGVEVYPHGWDWELETFVEGNYLAFRPPLSGIATIRWWKDDG